MKFTAQQIISTAISAASLFIAAHKWYDERVASRDKVATQDTLSILVQKQNLLIQKYHEDTQKNLELIFFLDSVARASNGTKQQLQGDAGKENG